MLNGRQKRIIMLLKDSERWITGKELSELLHVSDRTIRSDIAYINLHYDYMFVQSNRSGYHINEEIPSGNTINSENEIPQTCFQRCFYIVHELLFKENELNLVIFMNKVFVSDSSIENDLKKLKEILKPYPSLELVRYKSYISLKGNEKDKRELYVNLLLKKIKGNLLNFDFLAALFPKFDLFTAKKLLEVAFKKYNYSVREMEFPVVMAYIGVAISRMLSYNYIEIDDDYENIVGSTEFSIAEDFYKDMSKELHFKIKKDESIILALILLGKIQADTNENMLLINSDYKVNQLVSDILESIYVQFDVDLRGDEDLKDGLSTHIQQLLHRKKNNIQISNLYLNELKYKYPFFFEMAIKVGEIIENNLNVSIDENDISFIEQHLGAALERMNYKDKYRVIIINPNNQALSRLCTKKIAGIFHERITVASCMNYFEEKEVSRIKPDLILTTFPLEHNLDILTVQISIFINSEDEIKIFKALNLLDNKRFKEEFVTSFRSMMEPRFFYFDLDLDTPEEVLSFMSDELYNAGLVDKDFKEAVLKREELSPTSFVYSFAIPHPLTAISKESKIAVALLKRPIQWGEFKVKLVLLLAIQKDNEKIIRTFFDWLSDIVGDPKKLTSIMKIKNYDEFISLILK